MDLGAGRLAFHHKKIMNLLDDLKLKHEIIPITNTKNYIEYNKKTSNVINKSKEKQLISDLLFQFFNSSKIANLSHSLLKKLNLNQLFSKFFSRKMCKNIENTFEYKCKLKYFNADDAVYYFKHDYNKYSKFFVLKNGLHIMIDGMLDKIKTTKNYVFKKNMNVKKINYDVERNLYNIKYNTINSTHSVYSKFVICALPRKDLIKFDIRLTPLDEIPLVVNKLKKHKNIKFKI